MSHVPGLLKAIRIIGSQRALANKLNTDQAKINYYVVKAKKIPYDTVLEIELLTGGLVTRYELAPDKKELNDSITMYLRD